MHTTPQKPPRIPSHIPLALYLTIHLSDHLTYNLPPNILLRVSPFIPFIPLCILPNITPYVLPRVISQCQQICNLTCHLHTYSHTFSVFTYLRSLHLLLTHRAYIPHHIPAVFSLRSAGISHLIYTSSDSRIFQTF